MKTRGAIMVLAGSLIFLASPARAGALADALKSGSLRHADQLLGRREAPDDPADEAARCRLLTFDDRLADAAACLERRLTLTPDDPKSIERLALVRFRAGDFAEAAELYARAGRGPKAAEARALAAAPDYVIPSKSVAQRVPFVRRDPLPIVMARLPDGALHAFVLDTGASETVLTPELADKLGLAPLAGGDHGVFAGGKTAEVRYAILPDMTLGEAKIERIPVMLLSTASFTAALGGTPVEGVVGVDLLRRFTVTIDYPHDALILRPAGAAAGLSGRDIRFWLAGDHFILAEGAVDGNEELALVDTGLAGEGCTAPTSTLEAIGAKSKGDAVSGVGGGGALEAYGFTAKTLSLGPATRTAVPCLAGPFPPTLETSTGTRIGLLVSHAFLENYAVTFDFRAMRMRLDAAAP